MSLFAALALLAVTGGVVLPSPAVDPASGVSIQLSGFFREPPAAGFLPVLAEIHNGGERAGTWRLSFESQRDGGQATTVSRFALSVEPAGTRREELMVPLFPGSDPRGVCLANVSLLVSGPGVTGGSSTVAWRRLVLPLPPFAMSDSVALGIWEGLEAAASGSAETLAGSRFDPRNLPSDWRAWVWFERVFLTRAEWTSLLPGPRQALRAWVARGGRLLLTDGEPGEHVLGLGRVVGLGEDPEALRQAALEHAATLFREQADDATGFTRRIPAVGLESGPIALFMLLFALLVGPVNLFVLCRGPRRPLLFWTVPALSLGASLLLALFILAQDGTGGKGARFTAVVLLPEDHLAAVLQEQASRTGVLLGTAFESREPLLVLPLGRREDSPRRLLFEGPRVSGLFTSRTRRGQYLETLRPTRARLELVAGFAGPEAVSSLPEVLERLYLVDEAGAAWQGRDLAPGHRTALTPTGRADAENWLAGVLARAGPRLTPLLRATPPLREGQFVAQARPGGAIETLPAIDWATDTLVYVGPVSRVVP